MLWWPPRCKPAGLNRRISMGRHIATQPMISKPSPRATISATALLVLGLKMRVDCLRDLLIVFFD